MRTIELLVGTEFQPVEGVRYLSNGCKFRMFEADGEPVVDMYGNAVFLATSDPYWHVKFSAWVIDIDTTKYEDVIN
jgi:hypothetical protein